MARYVGPKRKLERREKVSLFGTDKWKKRPTSPGQHGDSKKRPSSYAIQFREKQKVKIQYGLLEKQFVNLYKKAVKQKGNTGLRMLQLLEFRLDNIVFRLGFAKTRNQARQLVSHKHVNVNGGTVNIPSYTCKVGDHIEMASKYIKSDLSKIIKAETDQLHIPNWLNKESAGGKVTAEPMRDHIDRGINEHLIVELYSR